MVEFLAVKKSLQLRRPAQEIFVAEVCSAKFCRIQINEGKSGKVSFSKKSGRPNKKQKVQIKELTIQVGVMDDSLKIKRGKTIPLKVNSLATHDEILAAAKKKHGAFNKRFDREGNYQLVFKDGRRVNFIPGTDPPESFEFCSSTV